MSSFKKLNLRFEVKNMGLTFYVPIVIFLVVGSYLSITVHHGLDEQWLSQAALLFEFILCPFGAWWIIYLYSDFYEDNNEELLMSLPVHSLFYGIFRLIPFLVGYFILLSLFIIMIFWISPITLDYSVLLFRFGIQTLVYVALCFFLVIAFKNSMVPILVVVVYLSTSFLMGSDAFPVYQIISYDPLDMISRYTNIHMMINFIISLFFFLIGHIFLAKRMRGVN